MDGKVYFNLSSAAISLGGSGVYAWEVCHRLMRLAKPLQVIPYTCPFKTLGKKGFSRIFNAILRDTIWDNVLAGLESDPEDYLIFPSPDVPSKFYHRKYAMVVHDIAYWHDPSITTLGGRLFVKRLPMAIKHADCLITVSDYTAQDISKEFGIPISSIVVVPNGLSEMYKTEALPIKSIKGISIPEKYFLHVGNFSANKNLCFLVEVYEQFRNMTGQDGKDYKLILTGGQYMVNFHIPVLEKIRNSPYVSDIIILGKVNGKDLPSLYKNATTFVFPSKFEGFGIPVIEALSQGTPALVNANTSLTQFGDFGATVFNNFEIDIWASKLKEIALSGQRVEQEHIGKIINYFDWDRTAKIIGESIGLL